MQKGGSRRRSDWRAWVRRSGLAGALALPFAPGAARASANARRPLSASHHHRHQHRDRVAPQIRFAYGLDVRQGQGPTAGFFRLEGRGLTLLRFSGALLALGSGVAGEVGVAFQTDRRGTDIGGSAGLHLGASVWQGIAGAQLEGSVPFIGNRRNYDIAFAGVALPHQLLSRGRAPPAPRRDRGDAHRRTGAQRRAPRGSAGARVGRARARVDRGRTGRIRLGLGVPAHGGGADGARGARRARRGGARGGGRRAPPRGRVRSPGRCAASCCDRSRRAPLCARGQSRSPDRLAQVAREAWLDGCVMEGIAATQAGDAALVTRDPRTADAHTMIARDERRHAELAWRVLGWAWREGGTRVRDAIVAAADEPAHAPAPAIDAEPRPRLAGSAGLARPCGRARRCGRRDRARPDPPAPDGRLKRPRCCARGASASPPARGPEPSGHPRYDVKIMYSLLPHS